ncbi:MAG: M23 family metallopeptidase [Bacilli bacterium]|nr:M23 family metallopeptidase [Bacilli bacterium]
MKKRRLKTVIKIPLIMVIVVVLILGVAVLVNNNTKTVMKEDDFTYVNDYIFDTYVPVVNNEEKIVKPYESDKVTINKSYYEKDDTEENQKNSIIYHEGIYMQNSGVSYKSDEEFDIVASLSGTVTNVSDDSLLGKTVEIKNSNNIITLYQSLKDVVVKKGDTITQGQIIAKSGTCSLYKDVSNGLHFEIYKNGSSINPTKYYDKLLKDALDNE